MDITDILFASISFLLLCLVCSIIVLVIYSGVFEIVEVKAGQPPLGKVTIAYKFFRGPYEECGPEFSHLSSLAPDKKAIGIYYDDPNQVSRENRRYVLASILTEEKKKEEDGEGRQEEEGGRQEGRRVDEDLVKRLEAEGYKMAELPRVQTAVTSTFPYRCVFSIFMAVRKVYPKMSAYIQERGLEAHPFVEFYEGETIHFMAPLDQQESFYMPETFQQQPTEAAAAGDSEVAPTHTEPSASKDTPQDEEGSLLHPSQISRAELVGRMEDSESLEKDLERSSDATAEEEQEDTESSSSPAAAAAELRFQAAENREEEEEEESEKEGSPEMESMSVVLVGGVEGEVGGDPDQMSDEESASSFEELKLEAEEELSSPAAPEEKGETTQPPSSTPPHQQ